MSYSGIQEMTPDEVKQTSKPKSRWLYKIMQWPHLYTGLFLIPWLLVYATSALCLNHGPWINKTFKIGPPTWETLALHKNLWIMHWLELPPVDSASVV